MSDKNVLVIIDVQNCFMSGGSLGAEDFELIKELIKLINLKDESGKNFFDIIVFTKDTHPTGHKSFIPSGGPYPIHCRPYNHNNKSHYFIDCSNNGQSQCKCGKCVRRKYSNTDFGKNKISLQNMIENNFDGKLDINNPEDKQKIEAIQLTTGKIINFLIGELGKNEEEVKEILKNMEFYKDEIYGHDLSYLYKIAAMSEKYKIPNIYNPDVLLTAGTKNTDDNGKIFINTRSRTPIIPLLKFQDGTYIESDDSNSVNLIDNIKKKLGIKQIIIEMEKGMICDMDANSAFVYHVDYSNGGAQEIATKKEYSTGLLELLIKIGGNKLNIYNCGLVGNICVIQSAIHGAALSKLQGINNDTNVNVKFKYMSGFGTRFLTLLPPMVSKPTEDQVIKEVYEVKITDLNKFNENTNGILDIKNSKLLQMLHIDLTINKDKSDMDNLEKSLIDTQTGGYGNLYHKYMKYKSKYYSLKNKN